MSVTTTAPPQKARTTAQNIGLILSFIVLGGILLLPTPETLSTGGHRMIGVLAFAIILWMTSAVSYPVSATMITALTALLLGFSPNPEAPAKAMGTANALKLIISGYSSPAMILVGAAMFISVAMRKTGLDRRSWIDWLTAAAPFSIIMVIIAYFLTQALIKPEFKELVGGDVQLAKMRQEIGPMSTDEKKLLCISIGLLALWATGGKLHSIDTTTTTIVAIALFFFPKIGIMDWKFAQPNIDWGSIVMFGAGIGLGSVLLKTKAATWLAQVFVNAFSLESASVFILIAVMAAFLIVIHLGFASATALSSAMIPIVISIVAGHNAEGLNPIGVTMLMQYAICFGLVLPVNSPQGMVAYGTDTFDVKTFMTTGIPLTIIGYVMMLVFAFTYWHWIGIA